MSDRFVVTGSGRCGTQYMARLLTAAGVPCGHEQVYAYEGVNAWGDWQADSSWMAACHLAEVDVPVVLLVRHPLAVVGSWVRTWLSEDQGTPVYMALRALAPWMYDYPAAHDRALAMWVALNRATLARAEVVVRLEHLDAAGLGRLLRWAGAGDEAAGAAWRRVGRTDRYAAQTRGLEYKPDWSAHDLRLVDRAWELTELLGYDPEVIPGG